MGEGVVLDVLLSGDICTCTHRERCIVIMEGGAFIVKKGGACVGVAYD